MATLIPSNQAAFSLDQILAATGGALEQQGSSQTICGVCTDTRRITSGNAFFALKGANVDGHEHVQSACDSGASLLVVSSSVRAPASATVVRVQDTLTALGQLARMHRLAWSTAVQAQGRAGKLVAITGSAGKTTTSRAVAAALALGKPETVQVPAGNLNNAVGVPMVLLGLTSSHDYAVIEVGTNARGEIAYGAGLAQPDVAILTLVTCAHAAGLGSVQAIANEKGALFEYTSREGFVLGNGDDELVRGQLVRACGRKVIEYGRREGCSVRLVGQRLLGMDSQRLAFHLHEKSLAPSASPLRELAAMSGTRAPLLLEFTTSLLGDAGAYAAGAAIASSMAVLGDAFDPEKVSQALSLARGEGGRLQTRLLHSGELLIDDAYNANPASMAASIKFSSDLAHLLGKRLVLVLGEMRELGRETEKEHERLGKAAHDSGAFMLFAVGGAAEKTARVAGELGTTSRFVPDSSQAAPLVLATVGPQDLILVKGSRGVALERVVSALEEPGRRQLLPMGEKRQ